ncbi:hypothetical protein LZL87_006141 [Fusarium oxysporum]|nr:hypothetical protein LZL87_006141 [Fusarium oxysporum]
MKGVPSHSSPFASGDLRTATVGTSLSSCNEAEPTHLHNVDIYVWELSYQSATATKNDNSASVIASLGSYTSTPSTTDSSPSSHLQHPQSPNEDTSQYHSVSPTMPGIIGTRTHLANAAPDNLQPSYDQDIRYVNQNTVVFVSVFDNAAG